MVYIEFCNGLSLRASFARDLTVQPKFYQDKGSLVCFRQVCVVSGLDGMVQKQ